MFGFVFVGMKVVDGRWSMVDEKENEKETDMNMNMKMQVLDLDLGEEEKEEEEEKKGDQGVYVCDTTKGKKKQSKSEVAPPPQKGKTHIL